MATTPSPPTDSTDCDTVLALATTQSQTPAVVVPFDDGHIPENTAGVSTQLVRYPVFLARPPVVHVVDDAVPAELVDAIYDFTVAQKRPWGTYVTVPEAMAHTTTTATNHKDPQSLAVAVAAHFFQTALVDLSSSDQNSYNKKVTTHAPSTTPPPPLWTQTDHNQIAHGVAIWALASHAGSQVPYHLDYAEQIRYESNLIVPPLLAGTLQCTASPIRGGDFAVHTQGLQHYQQFGYKAAKQTLDYDTTDNNINGRDNPWITISYRYNRMILQSGHLPHLSTPILHITDPNQKRVIVGFNVFGHDYGPLVQAAPEHSQVFRRKVQLQRALQQKLSSVNNNNNHNNKITLQALTANKGLSKLLVLAKRERVKQQLLQAQIKLDRDLQQLLRNSNQDGMTVRMLMNQLASNEPNQWPTQNDVQVHINQRITISKVEGNEENAGTTTATEGVGKNNGVLRLGWRKGVSSMLGSRMVQPDDRVYLLL